MKKLQYNSPVVLTFALAALLATVLGAVMGGRSTALLFSVYRAPLSDVLAYPRLLLHVLGHSGWSHYIGNMLLLLVVGPPLEEKYGGRALLLGMGATALLTGLVQIAFFPHAALLGASGVVFFLIVLTSFSGMKDGRIPLTLVLVLVLYLGQEIVAAFAQADQVSQLAHILGGLVGAGFGFLLRRRQAG